MADTAQTLRTSTRPGGFRFERYFGIATAAAGLVGMVIVLGSIESVRHLAGQVMGTLYILAVAVVG